MSAFINKEYAMNFSRLINRCRMQEYNSLRGDKTLTSRSDKELIEMAGFGSYRNFKRYLAQENVGSL